MANKHAHIPVAYIRFDMMDDDYKIHPLSMSDPELRVLSVKKMTIPCPNKPSIEGGGLVVTTLDKPDQGFIIYLPDKKVLDRLLTDLQEMRNQLFGIKINEQN